MNKIIKRGYKTELKPNRTQEKLLVKACGISRFAYNWGLARKIEHYKTTGNSINAIELHKELNKLKRTVYPWMYEVSKTVPQEALRDLDRAFDNFFRKVKHKGHGKYRGKVGFPRFKSRRRGLGSFRLWGAIHIDNSRIKLPRIGWVRLKEKGYLPLDDTPQVKVLSATVSEKAGRWLVSLSVEQTTEIPEATGEPVAADMGINHMVTLSDGCAIDNPKPLKENLRKLRRLQKKLSRQAKCSNRRKDTRKRIAGLHYRIACIRTDALHKATSQLVAKAKGPRIRPSMVGLEDLNVSGMMKNRRLSRAVADVGMHEFRRQLAYKCEWYGSRLFLVPRFFPSSKTCSACGNIKDDIKLGDRTYRCEPCGLVMDRDLNAALNIKRELLAASSAERINGRGETVRPGDSGQDSVKRQLKMVG